MAATELILPQLGEGITEGTIIRWFKEPGDSIELDEVIYEVSTEKVDSEVPSSLAGVLTEILVPEGETVDVGAVLAMIEVSADAPAAKQPAAPPAAAPVAAAPAATEPVAPAPVPEPAVAAEPAAVAPASGGTTSDGRLLSPLVRRLIRENGLDADKLVGTGVGSRISRDDVLKAIDEMRRSGTPPPAAAQTAAPAETSDAVLRPAGVAAGQPANWPDGETRFEPFTKIRSVTAQRMAQSSQVAAYVQTVMEVDYENVERVRRSKRKRWRDEEGFSLTYLPFIVLAVADALAEWPNLNASVAEEGSEAGLRIHRQLNIGLAVDLDNAGLIVPVLRQADTLNMRGAARAMNELAQRARNRKLRPDDITGGTFTISNNGSFGTFTTAAIINQPQVAVLSTDGVARRPVVVTDEFGNESIAIHSVGYLSLGWDHRAFDGGYAAGFLGRVKQVLETHDWAAEI